MLIDEAQITVQAGHGGPGKVSFYPGFKSGPDGGNGGRGGDVYFVGTPDITSLAQFSSKTFLTAEDGQIGSSNKSSGRNGNDLIIKIPVGTTVINQDTDEQFEITDTQKKILVCKGGLGGRGNFELRSSRNTTPLNAQKGLPGEKKSFKLELRLIADIGLIGLPNAGKSSLLNELTAASVKTASYPFTTLEPNLGVCNGKVLADIPGLIEGASGGKGLGIKFLKHIEKVNILVHCIGSDNEDPKFSYQIVRDEMAKFNPELLEKPEIILLTKSDLIDKPQQKKIINNLKKFNKKVLTVSIYDFDSIEALKKGICDR